MSFRGTERELEEHLLFSFLGSEWVDSALDVGCHWSSQYYAERLRCQVGTYHGCDIVPWTGEVECHAGTHGGEDLHTFELLDKYMVGDVCDLLLDAYGLVLSVSSIEHSGISTYYVEDYRWERMRVFSRLYELTRDKLFVTFPFGKETYIEGQCASVTEEDLQGFETVLPELQVGFWRRTSSTEFHPIDRAAARDLPYGECVGCVTWDRRISGEH